jgi:hypothetical protein
MPSNTGDGRSPGGSWNDDWNDGTGGAKAQFFRGLGRNMENKGWKPVYVPGFDWAAIETEHFDIDTLFAAFDADAKQSVEGAHLRLSRWADSQDAKMPDTRLALAVYDRARPEDIEFITRKLQEGSRMGKQSMTGVIDLATGAVHEPEEGSGAGYKKIRINKPVFDQLRSIV